MPDVRRGPDRIILHMGAQKTASSLIRRTLKMNRDALAHEGIRLVDRSMFMNSKVFEHLREVTHGEIEADAEIPADIRKNFKKMVGRDESSVLITAEGMFSRLPIDEFYQRIAAGLDLFRRLAPDSRIEVILYVREQKAFVESCYTQLVQIGRDLTFEDYTGGELPHHLNWSRVCEDIAGAIGADNLHVRPFETIRARGSEGFLRDFLGLLDLDPSAVDRFDLSEANNSSIANRSFSQVAVDVARFTMPMLPESKHQKLRGFLQENFSTEQFDRPRYFSAEEAAALKALYAEDNRRLFERWIPDHSPEELGYA